MGRPVIWKCAYIKKSVSSKWQNPEGVKDTKKIKMSISPSGQLMAEGKYCFILLHGLFLSLQELTWVQLNTNKSKSLTIQVKYCPITFLH